MLAARLRAAGCVWAEDEAALLIEAATDARELESLAVRRIAGEPLEQLLGWAEFAGLRVRVAPGVFVPRRRTELLLRLAEQQLRLAGERRAAARAAATIHEPAGTHEPTATQETATVHESAATHEPTAAQGAATIREPATMQAAATVLELCCGAAPIATALAARLPEASVTAADLDPAAVAVAQANLEPRGGAVYAGDLFAGLPRGIRFDVIVANAPYVPSAEIANMPREARDHEHIMALDGGADGLELHRRIAADAAAWLEPGGAVLIETSRRQASVDLAIFTEAGWHVELIRDDELDATALHAHR